MKLGLRTRKCRTSVCTSRDLSLRNLSTVPTTSTNFLLRACSMRMSRAIKVPVLPTPALF